MEVTTAQVLDCRLGGQTTYLRNPKDNKARELEAYNPRADNRIALGNGRENTFSITRGSYLCFLFKLSEQV